MPAKRVITDKTKRAPFNAGLFCDKRSPLQAILFVPSILNHYMQPAALILSFVMLFFTAQPLLIHCQQMKMALAVDNCCGGESCGKEESSSRQDKKNGTEASGCNPFASCSQCYYIHTPKTPLPERIILIEQSKTGLGNQGIHPGYLKDSWHPPEFM